MPPPSDTARTRAPEPDEARAERAAVAALAAYAAARQQPAPPAPTQPLPVPPESMTEPASQTEPASPTTTMLLLGARAGAWLERIILLAFVLTAIGLALALT